MQVTRGLVILLLASLVFSVTRTAAESSMQTFLKPHSSVVTAESPQFNSYHFFSITTPGDEYKLRNGMTCEYSSVLDINIRQLLFDFCDTIPVPTDVSLRLAGDIQKGVYTSVLLKTVSGVSLSIHQYKAPMYPPEILLQLCLTDSEDCAKCFNEHDKLVYDNFDITILDYTPPGRCVSMRSVRQKMESTLDGMYALVFFNVILCIAFTAFVGFIGYKIYRRRQHNHYLLLDRARAEAESTRDNQNYQQPEDNCAKALETQEYFGWNIPENDLNELSKPSKNIDRDFIDE